MSNKVCRVCGRTDGMEEWEWADVVFWYGDETMDRGEPPVSDSPSGFYRQADDPLSLYALCDECNCAGLVPVDYRELTWAQVAEWLRDNRQDEV